MYGRLLVAVFLFSVSLTSRSDDNHHTLWVVQGNHNTVYLLGSLHALKAAESDLPPEALRAYASAKALVMEIDINEASASKGFDSSVGMVSLSDKKTLATALGPELYAEFSAQAKPLGLDPEFISHFKPWFAVTMLEQLELARLGFDPNAGVDLQLAKRAKTDHKEIIGLEKIEDQFEIFGDMSLDDQRRYVSYSLAEMGSAESVLNATVSAWRTGDTKALEQLQARGFDKFPDLYRKITTDRNRKWLPTITSLLNDNHDYLVVVGALHLIGKDGIVQLLRLQGYDVVQR
jgi:uncharacterized protein YbaP (TraB family)